MSVIQRFSSSRNYLQYALASALIAVTTPGLAGSVMSQPSVNNWYMQGSIAYTKPRKSFSGSVQIFPDPAFPADRFYPSKAVGHGQVALEFGRVVHFSGGVHPFSIPSASLGLSLRGGRITGKGSITSLTLPNQYRYSTKLNYLALLALARVNVWQKPAEQLGVSAIVGLGASRNEASKYQEMPQAYGNKRDVSMPKDKKTTFAYDLGVAVSKGVGHDLTLVASYEYLNLGKVRYGNVLNSGRKGKLSQPGLQLSARMQVVSLGVRYSF